MRWLLKWFVGGGLSTITKAIGDAQARKLAAVGDANRIEADQEIVTLKAKRDVLIAEIGVGGWKAGPRPVMGWSVALFIFDIFVVERVLGIGKTTDLASLGPELIAILMLIIGAYFTDRTITKLKRMKG